MFRKISLSAALILLLTGCGLFSALPINSYESKLERAYNTNTEVRNLSLTARSINVIDVAELAEVKKFNDETRSTLDRLRTGPKDMTALDVLIVALEDRQRRLEEKINE
jgi:hypothetical protein